MLSSDFNHEMGSLLRRLEQRIRNEPALLHDPDPDDVTLDYIERAIVSLVAYYISLKQVP